MTPVEGCLRTEVWMAKTSPQAASVAAFLSWLRALGLVVNSKENKSRVFGLKTGFLLLAFPAKLRYSLVNKGLMVAGWSRLINHSLF